MIQARRTPLRSPLEYQEGAGINEDVSIVETEPMVIVMSEVYTEIGLHKLRTWYQSGATIEPPEITVLKSTLAASNPIKTISRIIRKRNQRKIAPPIAVDLLLKTVEKNSATLRNTNPISMVDPMKIR
jgi:hypothetical protein